MKDPHTDQLGQRLKGISADLKRYIEKRIELLTLNIGEHISRWIAQSVQKVMGVLLLITALGFLLFALAIYLGEVLGSRSLGYVIVALPMIVAGCMFYYLKPRAMTERLQNLFESELIRAIEEERHKEDGALNLPKPEPEKEQEMA